MLPISALSGCLAMPQLDLPSSMLTLTETADVAATLSRNKPQASSKIGRAACAAVSENG